MTRNSWLRAVVIMLLAPALCAADAQGAPTIPDPFGLGPRLALVDYLENTLHAGVAPGASYDDLVASYWSLVNKPKTDAQAAKLDHIHQLQFTLKADFGVDASQITDEDVLTARLSQCEAAATISVTDTRPAVPPQGSAAPPASPADATLASELPRAAPEAVRPADVATVDVHGWLTDYQEAVRQSRTTSRPILVDFTGSDWCPWCVRLHTEVLNQDAFTTWAARHVVLLMVDFPRRNPLPPDLARQNALLAQSFGIKGLPTVLILTAEGTVIGRSGYSPGGAPAWIEALVGAVAQLR